jgi:hypothetical protein
MRETSDKLKENSHKCACIVGTVYEINLRQVERNFAQECMDSTMYDRNVDKLKENLHKSAWIEPCMR